MSEGSQQGFALIDSLVALAIAALVIPWLVWSMSGVSGRLSADRARICQLRLADRKLAEAITGSVPPPAHSAGREEDLDWTIEARPLTTTEIPGVDLALVKPVEITVEVENSDWLSGHGRVSIRTLHAYAKR